MPSENKIWNCPTCGREFRLKPGGEPPDGPCPDCEKRFTLTRRKTVEEDPERKTALIEQSEREEARLSDAAAAVLLTTGPNLPGFEILEVLEVVTAECVTGTTGWADLAAAMTRLFSGRSGKLQKVLREMRDACLVELKKEAASIGGNAVIAVDLDYHELTGKNDLLMLVATGTAVRASRAS